MNNFNKELIKTLINENKINSVDDITSTMKLLFKDVLEELLNSELEEQLGYSKYNIKEKENSNSRNGYSKKTVKTEYGNIDLNIPRDRAGEFKPQIVPKHTRDISGLENKIISLYATGMSTRDIHDQIKELYDIEISAEMVSNMTNKLLPIINEWQKRQIDSMYPFVFMDAIHFKVRQDNRVISKAAYVVLGINTEGIKEVLGIYIGENESSKFWLQVLTHLKNRGLRDALVFCVDGLNGFKEAVAATFPSSEVQRCIIHQIRNSLKYVPYKDKKKFATDLKSIYTSPSEEAGLEALFEVKKIWEQKYPFSLKSWETNWDTLSTFFKYSEDIRRIIYTTNVIESLNRQYRKVTKNKGTFPNDDSLLKMLYLATDKCAKKWTRRYENWDMVLNQLSILYGERLEKYTG